IPRIAPRDKLSRIPAEINPIMATTGRRSRGRDLSSQNAKGNDVPRMKAKSFGLVSRSGVATRTSPFRYAFRATPATTADVTVRTHAIRRCTRGSRANWVTTMKKAAKLAYREVVASASPTYLSWRLDTH